MKWEILSGVILYEILIIGGLGIYFSYKEKKTTSNAGFLLSNRDLPVAVVAVTLALTVLGTPHIFGVFEMSWFIGASSIWFGIAHAVLLIITITSTAIWARKANVTSVPEFISQIFGEGTRVLVACVMAGLIWGILTLESQGIGIIFATVTGVTIQQGAIIGGGLGILYVIIAGMKEIGWVNLINCIVMYIGLILTMIYMTEALPAGGWGKVADFYINQHQSQMLSLFGSPELLYTFALGTLLSVTFCQSISQQLLQPAMAAKNTATIRKTLWIAVPLNGLFSVFIAAIGLAAKADLVFSELGPKLAAPTMLVNSLPGWLVAWLMASLLGAVLSSFAMAVMAPATIFTVDIYKVYFLPEMNNSQEKKITRIMIVLLGGCAIAVSAYLPPIVSAMNWLFAWMTPVFCMIIIGLFWKRSDSAAIITMILTWVINALWSFTSLSIVLNLEATPNVYPCLLSSLVIGVASTLLMKGRPGLFKKEKLQVNYVS